MPSLHSPQDPGHVTRGRGPTPDPSKPGSLCQRHCSPWHADWGDLLHPAPPRPSVDVPAKKGPHQLKSKPPVPSRHAAPLPSSRAHLLLCHNVFQSGEANCPIRAGASGSHLCRRLINMLLLAAADKFQKQVVKGFCLYPAWKMRGVTWREREWVAFQLPPPPPPPPPAASPASPSRHFLLLLRHPTSSASASSSDRGVEAPGRACEL